jgi:hypothetical protein
LRGSPSRRLHLSSPANAGDPVRRGLSHPSLVSLEYWVTRPSAQLRTRRVTTRECVARSSNTPSRSRDMNCPSFASSFAPLRTEGAGKTGCALHPRSRVRFAQTKMHTSIQVQRRASGLPCAMVLRRTSCSSRCANSFSHRYQRIDGWRWPGWACILRGRDTSHGCQNHTTWPYAARSTPSLDPPDGHRPRTGVAQNERAQKHRVGI